MKHSFIRVCQVALLTAGVLSLAACKGNHEQRFMSHVDQNNDSLISQQEAQQATVTFFERIDDNEDGTIQANEHNHRSQLALKALGLTETAEVDLNAVQARVAEQFTQADTDTDGQLSNEEIKQAMTAQRFKTIDANGDNVISLQEFQQHKSARHGKRHHHTHD